MIGQGEQMRERGSAGSSSAGGRTRASRACAIPEGYLRPNSKRASPSGGCSIRQSRNLVRARPHRWARRPPSDDVRSSRNDSKRSRPPRES